MAKKSTVKKSATESDAPVRSRDDQWCLIRSDLAGAGKSLKELKAGKSADNMVDQLKKMVERVDRMMDRDVKQREGMGKRTEKVKAQFAALQKRAKTLGVELT